MTEEEQLKLFEGMCKEIKLPADTKFIYFGISHIGSRINVDIAWKTLRLGSLYLEGNHLFLSISGKALVPYSIEDPTCFNKISKEIADEVYWAGPFCNSFWPALKSDIQEKESAKSNA